MHDDLVERRFTAAAPNAVWSTDITDHLAAEGNLHLCAIEDVHSGRIVGYSMDARMTAALAVTALRTLAGAQDSAAMRPTWPPRPSTAAAPSTC